jgi:hypothetical protein
VSEPLWRYEDAVRDNPRRDGEPALAYIERIVELVEGRAARQLASPRLPYREPGSDDE